ncbi:hypothetical protein EVJ58_g8726 [Rhodofomes roseus]|uniref:Uncharacterized protein n=1 Tax=Rhodofomes roseus TaxID=34475 RepID=A0A4Y9Y1C7_9APHY|nr:hypothetical protein EVJ58_g8726 [Rhodofomes roseus]
MSPSIRPRCYRVCCVIRHARSVGARQLAKYKVTITRITIIEELASVAVLYSEKTGTSKSTITDGTIHAYRPFSEYIIILSGYALRSGTQSVIATCIVGTQWYVSRSCQYQLIDFPIVLESMNQDVDGVTR